MLQRMSPVVVLKRYFYRDHHDTLQSFNTEIKALSPEEKLELAELAAKELGVELVTAAEAQVKAA